MGGISLKRQTERGKVVFVADGASLIDIGDEVVYLAFHSKNQIIGPGAMAAIAQASVEVERNWRGLVIGSDEPHFCSGMNLMLMLMEAENGEWEEIDLLLRECQRSIKALRTMPRPVVAAPHCKTLGVGAEICLSADRVVLARDTYFGFEETGIGLIPAGGGCLAIATIAQQYAYELGFTDYEEDHVDGVGFGDCVGKRADGREIADGGERKGSRDIYEERMGSRDIYEERMSGAGFVEIMPVLAHLFESIALSKVSVSGEHAKKLGYWRSRDSFVVREEHSVAEAKKAVLELDRLGYSAPVVDRQVRVAGREGASELKLAISYLRRSGRISLYDAFIAGKLADVITGGQVPRGMIVPEQYLLDLERESFLSLCGNPLTQARMKHMLATGSRLYN